MQRVIVHIGLAKTGTTACQHFCHKHRRFLLHHGVLYPRRHVGRSGNHSPFVASYIAHRPEGPTVSVRWAHRKDAIRDLRAEIATKPVPTVLISSEHFSMHFDRSEALELAQDLSDYDCSIVVTLRDTHARFLSAYNTHVTAGGYLSLEDYARSTLIPGTRYMRMRETILIWQEAFGRDRIRIIDYDATPDTTGAILRLCGVNGHLPDAARQRRRISLDVATIDVLRHANAIIASRQSVPADRSLAAWAQLSLFSILCRRKLQKESLGETASTVSETTMQALDAIADTDHRWVAETYGIQLRGSEARAHLKVGTAPSTDATIARRAEAVVDKATRGLWRPSQALIGLWDRFATGRPN